MRLKMTVNGSENERICDLVTSRIQDNLTNEILTIFKTIMFPLKIVHGYINCFETFADSLSRYNSLLCWFAFLFSLFPFTIQFVVRAIHGFFFPPPSGYGVIWVVLNKMSSIKRRRCF